METLQARLLVERAFREEHERVTLLGTAQHAHRVATPAALAVPVTNSEPISFSRNPATGIEAASRLTTNENRGGSAAFMTMPSR